MKATIYVVVTYSGGYGDDIQVFTKSDDAVAVVMEYARNYWDTERLGRFPRSYDRLYEAWDDHDLWGSMDSRWELVEREIEFPDPAPAASR